MSEVNANYNPLSDWKEPNEWLKKAAEKYKRNGYTYESYSEALTEWNSGGVWNVPTYWLEVFKEDIEEELKNRSL